MLGLGIDTGGTYTDAVVYDLAARKVVASAKALTTRQDLAAGIREVLTRLPAGPLREVAQCSLSTTLATNACVEGKGARAALVLLGFDRELLAWLGPEYGLPPLSELILIAGRHGQHGEEVEKPDWQQLRSLIHDWRGRAAAFGVVEYWGLRNPVFEQAARDLIAGETGLPVVCAHELSGEINSLRRAVTTLLNARLIPLITDLLTAVRAILEEQGIGAPLSVVGSDGGLMSEEFARLHPIDTLLSGPAASILGGLALGTQRNGVVVDMGGTTTDIAVIVDGKPRMAEEGAELGNWRTGTRAIALHTAGLGGDSAVRLDWQGRLTIGPERVAPLAWLVWAHPGTLAELRNLATLGKGCEFVLALTSRQLLGLDEREYAILECLREHGAMSLPQLAAILSTFPQLLPLKRLLAVGAILYSSLTPTDFLHVTGGFRPWSTEAARLGVEALAAQAGRTPDALAESVHAAMCQRLHAMLVRAIVATGGSRTRLKSLDDAVLQEAFTPAMTHLSLSIQTDLPLIGLGAPIGHYLPAAARVLGTETVIPDNAAVANAVGAIASWIATEEKIAILPAYNSMGITGYSVHSSNLKVNLPDYGAALAFAHCHGKELAKASLRRKGGAEPFYVEAEVIEEHGTAGGSAAGSIFLCATVICRGRAEPDAVVSD